MEQDKFEDELVNFVVESEKFKTLLNKKFENRKSWTKPFIGDVKAHLPGTIMNVEVKKGDIVKRGQLLLIHEAMKMHNRIVAPVSGIVEAVNVVAGDKIPKDYLMIEIKIEE